MHNNVFETRGTIKIVSTKYGTLQNNYFELKMRANN